MKGRIVVLILTILFCCAAGAAAAGGYNITDLGALGAPSGDYGDSEALGINEAGQIVGWSTDASGYSHACLWQNGTITDLGMLPGGYGSQAWGINDAGQIVGSSWISDSRADASACLWQNGTITDLGTLPGCDGSEAWSINEAGQIVGASKTATGYSHACLWQNGTITDLGTLPGDWHSGACGINETGQIVGLSIGACGWCAALWEPGGTEPSGPILPPEPPFGTERHYLTGQLHAHWMSDDGIVNLTPLGLESLYALVGYDFIAPTEHHPDPKWSYERLPGVLGESQSFEFANDTGRLLAPWMFWDPPVEGIIHLGDSMEDTDGDDADGQETKSHILGAAFNWGAMNPSLVGSEDRAARLHNIRNDGGGLAFIAHPNSWSYPWSADTLMSPGIDGNTGIDGNYDGIEVFTGGLEMLFPMRWTGQSMAVDTWTKLLEHNRDVRATAADDFTSPWYAAFNRGCVTAVVDAAEDTSPTAADIETALRDGRFYASYVPWWSPSAASLAPMILGWWWDEGASRTRIRVYGPLGATVRFFTNLNPDEGEEVSLAPVAGLADTWEASYSASASHTWVRAEVKDDLGAVSLTQPIWWSKRESATAQWPSGSSAASVHAQSGSLVLDLTDAHLEVSSPQTGIAEVAGELVGMFDRPSASPPLGYMGYCYSFTPDVALSGTNYLTIAYDPSDVDLCREEALTIYHYDATAGTWVKLSSTVDLINHKVTAQISNLGLFALSGEIGSDTTAPQVSITAPGPGENISGEVVIQAEASDDNGVSSVRFFLDDLYLGCDTRGADGWSRRLDCSRYAGGLHTLHVLAQDGSGNETEAEVLAVIGGGVPAPTISITSPTPGTVFWDKVEANGTWSATPPLTAGLLHVGDMPVSLIAIGDGTWTAEASGLGLNGPYVLQVEGSDLAGNRATAEIEIIVRSFPDIPLDFWARDYIYATARANIVQGYPDGTYQPVEPVNRAQMAVYISRALAGGDAAVPTGPPTATFPDVATDYWAYKYVEYCYDNGVVTGYWDGYHPEETVNRAQMAVYVQRAFELPM